MGAWWPAGRPTRCCCCSAAAAAAARLLLLAECVTKLLRNSEYCSYAATAGKVFDDLDEAERKFQEVSMEERSKFKEETYSNVDGRKRTRAMGDTPKSEGGGGDAVCLLIPVFAGTNAHSRPNVATYLPTVA